MDIEGERESQWRKEREAGWRYSEERGKRGDCFALSLGWDEGEREKEGERKIAVETKGARENNVLDAGGKEGTSKWN